MGLFVQFLPPLEVLVVIEKVVAALAPGAGVNTAVLAGFRVVSLTEGPGERGGNMAFGFVFWRGCRRLGGCRCGGRLPDIWCVAW